MGTALILLAFIVLPSAVLGFLSWRAIENEKAYSRERLRESYGQFARLAARHIDRQLGDLEARWASEIDGVVNESDPMPTTAQLTELSGKEPLIAGYFLLSATGRAVYPPIPSGDHAPPLSAGEPETQVEHDLFNRLVARGEELEYRVGDLSAAIGAYQEIIDQTSSPRLRAMAEGYIGRTQLKNGDRAAALSTFRRLLELYPEARDQNRMYLRFLAQYQIAVALEGLDRDREALDALLELNEDLLKRSDAINTTQYSYYSDLIQTMSPRLLTTLRPADRSRYQQTIRMFGERNKKRISQTYFLQLLDTELSEMTTRRKHFSPRIRYMSARTEGDPFLLAYRALPDAQRIYPIGILAAQIDLKQLQEQLFPAIRGLQSSSEAAVTILGSEGNPIIGTSGPTRTPIAAQSLAPPFDFWQVAVYLRNIPTAMKRLDLRATLLLWLISLLLLSILFAAYLFVLRVRREAYVTRAQTTFVSNVTHELRTPLSSIKLFAELMEMQITRPSGEKQDFKKNAAQYLGVIRQECDRLGRLIDRVIDFSKIERRVKHYRFEYDNVGEVVSRMVASFRPYAEAHGFSLELSVDESLPPLKLDADAISQVLLNLLSNAVQYSQEVKEIRVSVGREDSSAVIEVSDRGTGIEPHEMDKVFDAFYTGGRRMDSRAQGGLGLGLALSREIVHAHGGDIRVRSEIGKGSTFSVIIPLTTIRDETERHRTIQPVPDVERSARIQP